MEAASLAVQTIGVQEHSACGWKIKIEQSDYYRAHRSVPPLGTQLKIVQRKRIVAETMSGESVGNLPTSFNYLASCIKHGWTYVGTMQSAVSGPPVAAVSVDFAAIQPK